MNRHLQIALAFLLAAMLPFTLAACNPASQGTVSAASGEQPTASVTALEHAVQIGFGSREYQLVSIDD